MRTTIWIILVTYCLTSFVGAQEEGKKKKKSYVEIPDEMALNGTSYSISAFSPKLFVKSADFVVNATQCVQFSFRLFERRVRLHAYTCQLSTGGFCSLDKFSYPEDTSGCTYLRPWTHKPDTFSFYFVLEKRARKYGKAYFQRQKTKRTTESRPRKAVGNEPFGSLEIYGIVPCSEACLSVSDMERLGSQTDGTFHRGRSNRLLY